MADVVAFPLSPGDARARIAEAVAAGRYWLPTPPGEAWERTVTTRQIIVCLERGEIDAPGVRDAQGNYAYRLRRYSAGVAILVEVVLRREGDEWEVRVMGVRHE